MLGMSNDKKFKKAPRGWTKPDWGGVPGCWDRTSKIVYAGSGEHGSNSLVLHETGHGIGQLLGLDNNPAVIEAHQRLYKKLIPYLQQDGPGGFAGRQELLAESFADYFKLSKKIFIQRYDEDWHACLEQTINTI